MKLLKCYSHLKWTFHSALDICGQPFHNFLHISATDLHSITTPLVIHTLWCITFTFSTSTLTEYWVNHPACSANWPVMPCYSSRLTIIYSPTFSGSSLLWTYWPFHHIIIIMTTCLSNKPTPTHNDTVINIYIAIN